MKTIMNKAKIEIYIGAVVPLKVNLEKTFEVFQTLLSDLTKIKINFPLLQNINTTVTITLLDKLPKVKNHLWLFHKENFRDEIILKFSGTIEYSEHEYKDYEAFETENMSANDFFKDYILADTFEKRFYDFIVSLDIARTGAFHPGRGLLFINNKFKKPLASLNSYPVETLEYTLAQNWPTFESLDILTTWNWYLKTAFPRELDQISSTSTSRALNALTYLYDSNAYQSNDLFWAMVGVEALYVRGKEKVLDQVRSKIQIFLGGNDTKKLKNLLDLMYEYRSRFIHGAQNLPSFFHIRDSLEEHETFTEQYSDTVQLAKSILMATLQRMAKSSLIELEINYTIA